MKKVLFCKIISVCMICVVVTLCFNIIPSFATEPNTEIRLTDSPEKDFEFWTFSDLEIADQTSSSNLNWEPKHDAAEGSLDKTVFNGKINFPAGVTDFGNYYFGSSLKWYGFIVFADGTDGLKLYYNCKETGHFHNSTGDTGSTKHAGNQIALFNPSIAGTTLRGNSELQFSLSVEYINENGDNADLKVGVFFNGKLYNSEYYTVKDIPKAELSKNLGFYVLNSAQYAVASIEEEKEAIMLDSSPEKDFEFWTFSDLEIADQTSSSNLNWEPKHDAAEGSLDKTVFNGKINFPAGVTDFGNYYFGSSLKWYGFIVFADGTDGLKLYYNCKETGHFHNSTGDTGSTKHAGNQIALFNPSIAGTTLRGNSELQFSLSVEYINENGDNADLKVGVFFNGKLYNSEYYTVKDIPKAELSKNLGFYVANFAEYSISSIGAEKEAILLDNSPEKAFDFWTFSDLNISDQSSSGNLNWSVKVPAISNSLDKTVFIGKIDFPAGTDNFGNYYFGSSENWYGLFMTADGTDGLKLYYNCKETGHFHNKNGDTGTTAMGGTQIATFSSEKAGTMLRGNKNLQFALSVEYIEDHGDTVDLKIGIFFDGILYDSRYYTARDIPKEELTQNIGFYVANSAKYTIASVEAKKETVMLDDSSEKDFDFWTFSDLDISDQSSNVNLNWNGKVPPLGNSLDKTVFIGKIDFPAETDNFGNYYFGSSENWYGFVMLADGTDGLKLYYNCEQTGHFHNMIGDTGTTAMTGTQIANFNSEKAGTTLRGNKDLQFALSVEYVEDHGDTVDLKVGVFFDKKLYDSKYYTVKDIPKAELSQNIGFYVVNSARFTIASIEKEKESVYLKNTAENYFRAWTFSDLDISDQSSDVNLNWNGKVPPLSNSLDKTIFMAKIDFPAGTDNFGNYYFGSSENWYGLFMTADGTDGLKLYYNCKETGHFHNKNGDTGTTAMGGTQIATFNSEKAGTMLRGNKDLQFALSVEYVEDHGDTVDLRVGVFFDNKLYDSRYYTVKDVPKVELSQNIGFYVADSTRFTIASIGEEEEPVYLNNAPENQFTSWTFSDFRILDQTSSDSLNWDAKMPAIGNSLHKTLFVGEIDFPAHTENFGNYYFGSSEKWYGFVVVADGADGLKLYYNCKKTGHFHNRIGDTGTTAMGGTQIATFNSRNAETTLRGNKNLQFALSVEYVKENADTVDLKVGVFFDGKLYNGKYYTVKDIPKAELARNFGFYVADSAPYTIASVGKTYKEKVYEELSIYDFSIRNTDIKKITGKDYRTENYCDLESLDGTAFSAICRFPESGTGRFTLGAPFWYGVLFSCVGKDKIQVAHCDSDTTIRNFVSLDPLKAGLTSFSEKEFTVRLTFDVTKKSNGKSNIILGVFINGKLYNGRYYCVQDVDGKTLTRNLQLYTTAMPFSIRSAKNAIDLSVYGFSNSNWKNQLGLR